MAGHKPTVWISDRYSAQQKHGERHQTCLAHLARDTAFALEHGSDDLPSGLSFGLEKRSAWPRPSPTSPHQRWRGKSEIWKDSSKFFWPRQPGAIWRESCKQKSGARETSFSPFVTIPARSDITNNTSERKLRPCVIQRKITNGYRAMWAAQAEADVETTIDTAKLKGANPFAVIVRALA